MSGGKKPRYDTKEGIQKILGKGLAGLNALVRDRYEAGYKKHERLGEFYVLGRWHADRCGNFGKILPDFIVKDRFPNVPDVLTQPELSSFLTANGLDMEKVGISVAMGEHGIPPEHVICPECHNSWTIENCHDAVRVHSSEHLSLPEFVGRPLFQVEQAFSMRTDAVYQMQRDILVRNDVFINRRPNPDFPNLRINERGWVGDREGINSSYKVGFDDELFFNVWRFYHKECNRVKLEKDERKSFLDMFKRAGFTGVELKPIPNEYWQNDYSAPWFLAVTEHGVFKIGWRKRVINIDWDDIDCGGVDVTPYRLFKGENTTKGTHFIHAWGGAKAIEYLSQMREQLANKR